MWVVRFALAVLALSFSASGAGTGTITVGWDRNPETNVAGYKIYWGEVSRQYTSFLDVGNNVEATLTELTAGRTYYCAVKAYNTAMQESSYSEEIPFTYSSGVIVAPDPSSRLVLLEAESGQLNAPAVVLGTGTNVYVDSNDFQNARNGFTQMSFSTDLAADYHMWCRVKAPAASTDSFYVTMDGGTEHDFHVYVIPDTTEPRSSDWIWKRVHLPVAGGAARVYPLTTGAHTLKIRIREQGTQLDRIILTSNPNFVPTDALSRGPAALVITGAPVSLTRNAGESATFQVTAASTGTVGYQWKKDNVDIPGATSAELVLSSVTPANQGSYSVALVCGSASLTAGPASLTVNGGSVAPSFRVQKMTVGADNTLIFDVQGGLNANVSVYASNDLRTWSWIGGQVNSTGRVQIFDAGAAGRTKRFYKLVTD